MHWVILFTVDSVCVISTIHANARSLIAAIGESITVTLLTRRKSPKIGLTFVTLFTNNFIIAVTLAGLEVANIIFGSSRMTVTCFIRNTTNVLIKIRFKFKMFFFQEN